jgi:protein-S-isoprenylcysteine O-methyltransferase Ste14
MIRFIYALAGNGRGRAGAHPAANAGICAGEGVDNRPLYCDGISLDVERVQRKQIWKMSETSSVDFMKERIPWLRGGWGKAMLLASFVLPFSGYLFMFLWVDRMHPYGAAISQMALSILACIISYYVMRHTIYRLRDHCRLTHRLPNWAAPFYLALVIAPLFALMVHPLMVNGGRLLPIWAAIPLGLFLIVLGLLMRRSAMTGSGFSLGHAFGIYLVFPEDGILVDKEVYAYLRHPLSAGVICIAIGFGFVRNNMLAILTALIYLIPILLEMKLEDDELIERFGDAHRRYMKETRGLFPRRQDLGKLLNLVFSRRR